MPKKNKRKERLTFEEAFKRLEQLTEQLEKGNLSLEDTLTAFKEGKGLLKYCEGLLGEAEKTLQVINFDDQPLPPELESEEE
ncbi:MAG: exodeoxyribonuclease VII small subunit [Firmicutes bacterium]|nr:exodeoxyribonuclease VII small subunit [Bacillota bacterium]